MQAKDLSREDVEYAMTLAMDTRGHTSATRWDIAIILQGKPELVGRSELFDHLTRDYEKVTLAKLRKLTRQGKIQGCYCGCRGDFYFSQNLQGL